MLRFEWEPCAIRISALDMSSPMPVLRDLSCRDFRLSLRQLRKAPGFSLAIVVTLALEAAPGSVS